MGERALDQPGLHRLQRGWKRRWATLWRARGGGQPALLQVLDRQPRVDGAVLGQDVALRVRVLVPVLDEEPVTGAAAGAYEGPRAAHLASLQREGELAGLQLLAHPPVGLVAVAERQDALLIGRIGPCVPDDHLARAIAAGRDYSLEVSVVQRVVLDHGGESLLARVEGRPLWGRPRLEHAVDLQPDVVVEAGRCVLLHHESEVAPPRRAGRRLGRAGEVAHGLVLRERPFVSVGHDSMIGYGSRALQGLAGPCMERAGLKPIPTAPGFPAVWRPWGIGYGPPSWKRPRGHAVDLAAGLKTWPQGRHR